MIHKNSLEIIIDFVNLFFKIVVTIFNHLTNYYYKTKEGFLYRNFSTF